ncbi:hypothetical protein RI054_44g152890 [Pseudoscourfieldia marina]
MRSLKVRLANDAIVSLAYDPEMTAWELKSLLSENYDAGDVSAMTLLYAGSTIHDTRQLGSIHMPEYHMQNSCVLSLEVSLMDKLTLFFRAGNISHCSAARVTHGETIQGVIAMMKDTHMMRIFTGMHFANPHDEPHNIIVKDVKGVTFVKLAPEPTWTIRQLKDNVLNYGIVAQNFTFNISTEGDLHIFVHPSAETDTSAQYYVRDTKPAPAMFIQKTDIPLSQKYDTLVHDLCVGPCLNTMKCGEEVLARLAK